MYVQNNEVENVTFIFIIVIRLIIKIILILIGNDNRSVLHHVGDSESVLEGSNEVIPPS